MIYGRKQIRNGEEKVWDYIACLYPEGNLGPDYTYVFDHKSIKKVFFIGFQDYEEIEYKKIFDQADEKNPEDELESMDKESSIEEFVDFEEFEINEDNVLKDANTEEDNGVLQIDTLMSDFINDSYGQETQSIPKKNYKTDTGIENFEDFLSLDINNDKSK